MKTVLSLLVLSACSGSVSAGSGAPPGLVNDHTFVMSSEVAFAHHFVGALSKDALEVFPGQATGGTSVADMRTRVELPSTALGSVGSDGEGFVACGAQACVKVRQTGGSWVVEPWLSFNFGWVGAIAYQRGRWVIAFHSEAAHIALISSDGHMLKVLDVDSQSGPTMAQVSPTEDGFLLVDGESEAKAQWYDLDLEPLGKPIELGAPYWHNVAIAASGKTASINLPPAYAGRIVRIDHERVLATYDLPKVEGAGKTGARFGLLPGAGDTQDMVYIDARRSFIREPVDVGVTAVLACSDDFSVGMTHAGALVVQSPRGNPILIPVVSH